MSPQFLYYISLLIIFAYCQIIIIITEPSYRTMRRIRYGGFFCAAARVQGKISRGNVTRGTAPKAWWNPYYNTRGRGVNTAARVQKKISRGYTRGWAEKHRRAGTGKDFPRIYPWPGGKAPPRGYRRGFPANIPVAGRKNPAARVQEKNTRGYTREHEKTSAA